MMVSTLTVTEVTTVILTGTGTLITILTVTVTDTLSDGADIIGMAAGNGKVTAQCRIQHSER